MSKEEKIADALEAFGRYYPVQFSRNLTKKMSILAINAPEQVKKDDNFYKYLKL